MKPRYVVLLLLSAAPSVVCGQPADAWRAPFAAGEQARQADEYAAYSQHMSEAARLLPAGHINRPFVQYHAARAAALVGRTAEAVEWLGVAWDEQIESLMISFAPFDPAFEAIADEPGFLEVMARATGMTLETRLLGGSVHLFTGAGSNVVAQIGPDGVLLVDTGYGPALPALLAAVESLGGEGIDRVVVTHPHEDHMGATPELGGDAMIIAHTETAAAMREPYLFMEGVSMPPKPARALPTWEIARDTSFTFNGEEVRLLPTEAHTAGDVTIYFTESRVAHFGDTYLGGNPMMFPGQIDPDGFLDRLEGIVDSLHPETVVVSGHDEPLGIDGVRGQIAESRACMALVRAALEEGLSLEQTTDRAADRFAPQWVGFFYRLFTQSG